LPGNRTYELSRRPRGIIGANSRKTQARVRRKLKKPPRAVEFKVHERTLSCRDCNCSAGENWNGQNIRQTGPETRFDQLSTRERHLAIHRLEAKVAQGAEK